MAALFVRPAAIQDLSLLEDVERQAAKRFNDITITDGLRKQTIPLSHLYAAQAQRLTWVAVEGDQSVIGFLVGEDLDENLHVSEMSVLPSHGRRGAGAALLRAARQRAEQANYRKVTLTTFAEVPWNGPFYRKQGFRTMLPSEIGRGLAARIEQERALGLDNRVAMCCSPGTESSSGTAQ